MGARAQISRSAATAREQEVLLAAREHATVAQVASALHLSPGTTRNHLSAIMGKLGAHSRIEALRMRRRAGCEQARPAPAKTRQNAGKTLLSGVAPGFR
jgi:DNA-binding NarL/FixJ family response regulator